MIRKTEMINLDDVLHTDPSYGFHTPYNAKRPDRMFGKDFELTTRTRASAHSHYEALLAEGIEAVAEAIAAKLSALTAHERKVVRIRLSRNARRKNSTQSDVADDFMSLLRNRLRKFLEQRSSPQRLAELRPVIEKIRRLEPSLIAYLQEHNEDLTKLDPFVFEHLVAEILAGQGFYDVRLVGCNAETSADIFAAKFIPGPDVSMRFFVEVKRWKDTIGIEVINEVLGAFLGERERFGWNAALLVTVGGFRDFKKWSREELALKGLHLRDRDDLLRYLDGYRQHANGLWLPNPRTDL